MQDTNQKKKTQAEITGAGAARVSLIGIAANGLLTAFKFLAGILAHSGAMLSDAAHSASDILSGVIVIIGVRIAAKAPDSDHPYGHERFECVATLLLAGVLALAGGSIGVSALRSVFTGAYAEMEAPGRLALAAAAVSIVVKEAMF